jgi:hypothetical protein
LLQRLAPLRPATVCAATDAIAATLRRLDRERMTVEVEALATALRLDLLDSGDCAR